MLRALRDGSRWLMWLIIIGVGAVFVLFLGFQGSFSPQASGNVVVQVGERSFDTREVEILRADLTQRYQEQLGDQFDADGARGFVLEQAAGQLLRTALLAGEAERIGLRVSDREVRDYLKRIPGTVGEDGTLDRDVVTNWAQRRYGSLRRFQERLRDELLAQKASRLLLGSVAISDTEARESLRYAREEVRIAAVRFAPNAAGEEPSAEAVTALLGEEGSERIREAYDRRRSEFDQPEQVKASHILLNFEDESDEAKAKARTTLEELKARIEGGEDFAALAEEFSDDPGSKTRGGDLGFFPRGRMVKPFEDSAFSLSPGELSDPVESPFGVHLIRVEERKEATSIPFEEARETVAKDLAREDAAGEKARADAEAFAAALADGMSLIDAARERELDVLRPDPIRRRPDGFVPGLGAAPELVSAAFALDDANPTDTTLHDLGGGSIALIELIEHVRPTEDEIEVALDEERARLLNERRQAVQLAWIGDRRSELEASGELTYNLEAMDR